MNYTAIELDPQDERGRASVAQLLERCRIGQGRPPLDDHALFALVNSDPAIATFGVLDPSGWLSGYVQATPTSEVPPTWTIDVAIDPRSRHDRSVILDIAFSAVLESVHERNGRAVQWWCHEATDTDRAIAERHGLRPARELLEMRSHLSTLPERPHLPTRPFEPGRDETQLLEVNNLAFDGHPDQGSWTHESLTGRQNSDWFDPCGLLVHCDDRGTMLGFCWTKVHRTSRETVGEIYVVGVRPSLQGRGLGRALTLAGLMSLRQRGIDQALLFVDRTNAAALTVYRQLGFSVVSTSTALQQTMGPSSTE